METQKYQGLRATINISRILDGHRLIAKDYIGKHEKTARRIAMSTGKGRVTELILTIAPYIF